MNKTILQSWNSLWPNIRSTSPLKTGTGVIDQATFNTIEADELFDQINHAQTIVGKSVLYRSLAQPLDALGKLKAKQEAVKELQDNENLKTELENIVKHAADNEKNLYLLLFGEFLGSFGTAREEHEIEGYGYLQYIRGVRFMLELVHQIERINSVKSAYLSELLQKVKTFSESRTYSLMHGPAYISEKGIQSKQDRVGSFVPAVIFKPSIFKPLLIAMIFAAVWLVTHFFPTGIFSVSTSAIPITFIFFIPLLLIYFPIIGGYDRDHCIIPLRNEYRESESLAETLDALGQLDELLSFVRFSEVFGGDMVLPKLQASKHHKIKLSDARNPVLAKQNPDYVGNNFTLDKERLVLITGPNSGGKTAFCKTICQIQLLTQIGCFIPAKNATMTVADHIFYQAPDISHLDDGEGRFGTELKRTKAIFLSSTAKSLVILDELSEGTTFEEKMESSVNVLEGFYEKGNNTILITHNHQLVDYFNEKKIGLARQVEFKKNAPTYKLIKGISRVSHADRVAKKIGFSKEDIKNYLTDSKKS